MDVQQVAQPLQGGLDMGGGGGGGGGKDGGTIEDKSISNHT